MLFILVISLTLTAFNGKAASEPEETTEVQEKETDRVRPNFSPPDFKYNNRYDITDKDKYIVTEDGDIVILAEIDNAMFMNNTSLTNVTIPDGVSYISPFAFTNCASLSEGTKDRIRQSSV